MFDDGFYFFDKGSIGELQGYKKIQPSPQEEQRLLDHNTREKIGLFNPPPGLSPSEYSGMFMDAFMKARNETQNGESPTIPFVVTVQVGNSESLREIETIEKHYLFSHWEQPRLAEDFKFASRKFLNY